MNVLLFDDFPIERPGEDRLKVGVFFRFPLFRSVEPLVLDSFQLGHKPHRTGVLIGSSNYFTAGPKRSTSSFHEAMILALVFRAL